MPRYYFKLDTGGDISQDATGVECADLGEAIELAEEIASGLRDRTPVGRLFERYILICDEAGNEVKRLPIIPGSGTIQ